MMRRVGFMMRLHEIIFTSQVVEMFVNVSRNDIIAIWASEANLIVFL